MECVRGFDCINSVIRLHKSLLPDCAGGQVGGVDIDEFGMGTQKKFCDDHVQYTQAPQPSDHVLTV